MKATLHKTLPKGIVNSVPSKSYGHRFIIASMLSDSDVNIDNIVLNDDIKATLNALMYFGKKYEYINNRLSIRNNTTSFNDVIVDCNESGSTLRFLIPIMLTRFNNVSFLVSDRLINRGIGVYEKLFGKIGIKTNYKKNKISFIGKLVSGNYSIPGDVSSQFITGLLFSLCLLDGDSTLSITTKIESIDYIYITLDVLNRFGISIDYKDNVFYIKGNQRYVGIDCFVEGDYSNASFIDAFNYFGGDIKILGLNINSYQGDKKYIEYFKMLSDGNPTINIENQIDLGPILMAFASLNNGAKFTGTKRLKIKESNRSSAMQEELMKFNVKCDVNDNDIVIYKSDIDYDGRILNSHNDHRIVMALSLFLVRYDITIDGIEAVNKSYPSYFKTLESVGVKIDYE